MHISTLSGKVFAKRATPILADSKVRLTQQIPYKSDPAFLLDAPE
jgi:hypothetical protein